MCRLLGIYGQVDFWQKIALQFSKLAEFGNVPPIANAPGHKDGWGMAKSNDEKTAMVATTRQLGSAYRSSIFHDTIQSIKDQPHIFLCHLRKASPNIPIDIKNVQPFFKNEWAFVHNGTIYDPNALAIDPSFELSSKGSDSEYLFYFLLTIFLNERGEKNILTIIAKVIASLTLRYTAINCILSNGRELFVITDYKKFRDYYTLFYYRLPKGMIICSEPLDLKELNRNKWQKLPNRSILKIYKMPPNIELF